MGIVCRLEKTRGSYVGSCQYCSLHVTETWGQSDGANQEKHLICTFLLNFSKRPVLCTFFAQLFKKARFVSPFYGFLFCSCLENPTFSLNETFERAQTLNIFTSINSVTMLKCTNASLVSKHH